MASFFYEERTLRAIAQANEAPACWPGLYGAFRATPARFRENYSDFTPQDLALEEAWAFRQFSLSMEKYDLKGNDCGNFKDVYKSIYCIGEISRLEKGAFWHVLNKRMKAMGLEPGPVLQPFLSALGKREEKLSQELFRRGGQLRNSRLMGIIGVETVGAVKALLRDTDPEERVVYVYGETPDDLTGN